MTDGLERRLAETIRREGPIRFDRYMEAALYDPEGGFFSAAGGAGRAEGDFVTSPETGSLFGAVVASALDGWWRELGEPDPFVVVDAGAGRGQLARDVMRVAPACSPALRYVMVERSARLRRLQHEHLQVEPPEDALGPAVKLGDDDDDPEPVPGTGPIVTQTESLPGVKFTGVVVANELLDNLPFRLVERGSGSWHEVRVGAGEYGFSEVLVPAEPELAVLGDELLPGAANGTRLPLQTGIRPWLAECAAVLRRGCVLLLDYAEEVARLAERGPGSWLRTYRAQAPGAGVLEAPGSQDITADVVVETLLGAARREGFDVVTATTQAEWLDAAGMPDLVAEGERTWRERAHLGDLEALKGRSRVHEAEVLSHPEGLGAHRVFVLRTS